MIIYNDTLGQFIKDAETNLIATKVQERIKELGVSGGNAAEYMSWVNSLPRIKDVVNVEYIPKNVQVAIEYQIPQTSKRVDFIIVGNDGFSDNIIIIELKQWMNAKKISDTKEHSIEAFTGGTKRLVAHPSYQAYSYAVLIRNTSEVVQNNNISIVPCAYLHNYLVENKDQLINETYQKWLNEAPLFISNEYYDLQQFISKYIKHKANDGSLLYKIDHGRLKPSKALQDAIVSMMKGNKEFLLIDDQIIAYDICCDIMDKCKKDGHKRTIIIQGGPGTGKSVLALNLMKRFVDQELMANYVTKNSAPRKAFLELISKSDLDKKAMIKSLFRSPFGLSSIPKNKYDCLIVDEAHRLVEKMYGDWQGNNQIAECINSSLLSIFLIDEDQQITTKDIGSIEGILKYAEEYNSEVYFGEDLILRSQFRCNGSDTYIQFINKILQISDPADVHLYDLNYDIKVFDNPNKLRDELREINQSEKHFNKVRMVAGYCYPWNIKNNRNFDYDIALEDGFKAKWNLPNDPLFAINLESFEQVGCIHTTQGLEFDYVGVIIGKDLQFDKLEGKIFTDKLQIDKDDRTSGIRSTNNKIAEKLIKNTYKTLMTRGQKGCYIYCEDKNLRDYIKKILN
ncbi:MAG: DUF2075 domain-containing protein [Bacillota bacterium]